MLNFRCFLLLLLFLFTFQPARSMQVDPATLGAAAAVVSAIIDIAEIIIQDPKPVACPNGLTYSEPGIKVNKFFANATKNLNVGDSGTIFLDITVSYGDIDGWFFDYDGEVIVEFYVDDKVVQTKRVLETNQNEIVNLQFHSDFYALNDGSIDIKAIIHVKGIIDTFFNTDGTDRQQTNTITLDIEKPYQVYLKGPNPREIVHGDTSTIELMLSTQTVQTGHITVTDMESNTIIVSKQIKGVKNNGQTRESILITETVSHSAEDEHLNESRPFFNLKKGPYQIDYSVHLSPRKGRINSVSYKEREIIDAVFIKEFPLTTNPEESNPIPEDPPPIAKDIKIFFPQYAVAKQNLYIKTNTTFSSNSFFTLTIDNTPLNAVPHDESYLVCRLPDKFRTGKNNCSLKINNDYFLGEITILNLVVSNNQRKLRRGKKAKFKVTVEGTSDPLSIYLQPTGFGYQNLSKILVETNGGKKNRGYFEIEKAPSERLPQFRMAIWEKGFSPEDKNRIFKYLSSK